MARRIRATGTADGVTVSVVVPCYNYGDFLPACVASILDQRHVTPDVLVIDDASPDGSGEVADKLAREHPLVRVIRHETNQGHIATYNEGLAQVEGDYVALLSADDLMAPGALDRAAALMEARPEVGIVYGHPVVFSGESSAEPITRVRNWTVWPGAEWIRAQCHRGSSLIYSPEAVVRTKVQHEVGGYRADLPHSGDLEMWLRIATVADVGRVNGPVQALKRVHDTNMITTYFAGPVADLQERNKAYETYFSDSGRRIEHVDELRQLARKRMAAEAIGSASHQLATGEATLAEVAANIDFAREIYPEYQKLRAWREYRWRVATADSTSSITRLRSRGYEGLRDLRFRANWHWWHRFGT
jgi:hypothetical protein